jgi:hypothetical protein
MRLCPTHLAWRVHHISVKPPVKTDVGLGHHQPVAACIALRALRARAHATLGVLWCCIVGRRSSWLGRVAMVSQDDLCHHWLSQVGWVHQHELGRRADSARWQRLF